jgi:hypothetical protein
MFGFSPRRAIGTDQGATNWIILKEKAIGYGQWLSGDTLCRRQSSLRAGGYDGQENTAPAK